MTTAREQARVVWRWVAGAVVALVLTVLLAPYVLVRNVWRTWQAGKGSK